MQGAPRIAMVAGEASGDLLAGLLLGGMRARWPSLQAQGIGGPRMAAQGFEAWWPHDRLAVMGYADVLPRLWELLRIRRQLGSRLLAERPDAFIGVDAPDFNFGLEERLRRGGIKTIHFVSPSIWAWRGERVLRIGRAVDHVLCLFPFEPALYEKHGIGASYVGHPLADAIPLEVPHEAARQSLGLQGRAPVVALLPGSRTQEILHIAPVLMGAAARLRHLHPDVRFAMPVVPGQRHRVEPLAAAVGGDLPLTLVEGRSHEVLAACDVAIVASGTATLEAALFKRPMVITYRMHWLSWRKMKGRNYLPWVGLPNILSEDFVVPELIQDAATPEALAEAASGWLSDPQRCLAVQARFTELHHRLRRNTAQAATDAIQKVIEG